MSNEQLSIINYQDNWFPVSGWESLAKGSAFSNVRQSLAQMHYKVEPCNEKLRLNPLQNQMIAIAQLSLPIRLNHNRANLLHNDRSTLNNIPRL